MKRCPTVLSFARAFISKCKKVKKTGDQLRISVTESGDGSGCKKVCLTKISLVISLPCAAKRKQEIKAIFSEAVDWFKEERMFVHQPEVRIAEHWKHGDRRTLSFRLRFLTSVPQSCGLGIEVPGESVQERKKIYIIP